MTLFSCIKCQQKYDEKDEEAYLCPKCLNSKKAIAEELDKKYENKQPKCSGSTVPITHTTKPTSL